MGKMKWFKWYIKLVNRFGFKKEPAEFNLFTTNIVSVEWLASKLRSKGYYYNDFSTTYLGQLYTVRKLLDLDHQYHLRVYPDRITGHYELRPEHASEHLKGIELRRLHPFEIEELKEAIYE